MKRPSKDEFVDLWNSSLTLAEAAIKTLRTERQASSYANLMRDKGHALTYMNQVNIGRAGNESAPFPNQHKVL